MLRSIPYLLYFSLFIFVMAEWLIIGDALMTNGKLEFPTSE